MRTIRKADRVGFAAEIRSQNAAERAAADDKTSPVTFKLEAIGPARSSLDNECARRSYGSGPADSETVQTSTRSMGIIPDTDSPFL